MSRRLAVALTAGLIAVAALFVWQGWPESGPNAVAYAQSPTYAVELRSERPQVGVTVFELAVRNASGGPVDLDGVMVEAAMPVMGHATPPVTAVRIAAGRYQARGELFSMPGAWEVTVRLGATGETATATVAVTR